MIRGYSQLLLHAPIAGNSPHIVLPLLITAFTNVLQAVALHIGPSVLVVLRYTANFAKYITGLAFNRNETP